MQAVIRMDGSFPKVEFPHETVVFDFDGVLAEDVWPEPRCGSPVARGLAMMRHYNDLGFAIVVHTARPDSHRQMIWDFLNENELAHMVYDVICGKPRAGLYIDDRGYRFEG